LEDVRKIVPDAREATVFQLAAALGRRDRKASLELLDTIVRDGEYLPLALNSLASQFRFAITAREAKLTNAGAIQKYFNDRGVSMWRGRAEQVSETAAAFRVEQMRAAVQGIFEADRGLRDTRPDDRTVMEQFILRLTSTT
jgi:DNA polymerase-3 subunit delta